MAAGASTEETVRLLYSATWTTAVAALMFIAISLAVERFIFFIGRVAMKRKQVAIYEALEKIKEELMMVGFISLALTVGQSKVASICVPSKIVDNLRQCNDESMIKKLKSKENNKCGDGKEQFISETGLHQLHILIFVWVIVHVVYSVVVMGLGASQVHYWKRWEEKAREEERTNLMQGNPHRLTKETTFVQSRFVSRNCMLSYLHAFFRMFLRPVAYADYATLRNGFIKSHMPNNVEFDFHKYITRTLHDDFKHVVGVSLGLWVYAVLTIFLNIDGWEIRIWAPLLSIAVVLIIGTNLQTILSKMASEIAEKHTVVAGIPNVRLGDELFLFNRPKLVLSCIHFIVFQNAMELATHLWARLTFKEDDCMFNDKYLSIALSSVSILFMMLCGFTILPIYALVSQMGTNLKRTIFAEHVQMGIQRWRREAGRAVHEKPDHDHGHDDVA